MEFKGNNFIQIFKYEKDNPIDEAYSITNWLDDWDAHDICKIARELQEHGCMNEYGNEVVAYLELFGNHIATNKGIGERNLNRYIKFRDWCIKNKIDYYPDIDKAIAVNSEQKSLEEFK